jgi:hypothetical protein
MPTHAEHITGRSRNNKHRVAMKRVRANSGIRLMRWNGVMYRIAAQRPAGAPDERLWRLMLAFRSNRADVVQWQNISFPS